MRFLGYLWAFPVTAVGLLVGSLAALTGGLLRVRNGVVVTVGLVVGGKVTPDYKVLVSGRGLFFGMGGLAEVKFPYPHLKLPARPGDRWDWEVGEVGRKVVCTVGGTEEVEVPAGKFQAVRVEGEAPVGKERTLETTRWYAPGVGWVKQVTRLEDVEEKWVLKAFTPGKN